MDRPRTIHDFGGFPCELFEVQYPAPGDPALASHLIGLLSPTSVELDHSWGLDHGTWSVLVHMFPEGGHPCCAAQHRS
jgi:4,5-DOPA dioxygenase extradiol